MKLSILPILVSPRTCSSTVASCFSFLLCLASTPDGWQLSAAATLQYDYCLHHRVVHCTAAYAHGSTGAAAAAAHRVASCQEDFVSLLLAPAQCHCCHLCADNNMQLMTSNSGQQRQQSCMQVKLGCCPASMSEQSAQAALRSSVCAAPVQQVMAEPSKAHATCKVTMLLQLRCFCKSISPVYMCTCLLGTWQRFEGERHLPLLDAEALDHSRQVTNSYLLRLVLPWRQHLHTRCHDHPVIA